LQAIPVGHATASERAEVSFVYESKEKMHRGERNLQKNIDAGSDDYDFISMPYTD
jgi:hypothetical protein